MDGHRGGCGHAQRTPGRLLIAGGLLACSALSLASSGCVPQLVPSSPEPPPKVEKETADADLPKREPKASTCIAYGDFHYRSAFDGERSPAQREQLLETARKAYQQALKLEPTNLDAFRGLAHTYQQLGDKDRAVTTYEKAIKAYPQDASLEFELGMYQARQKQWDLALTHLQGACRLDPENRTYGNMLAYSLARMGRYDESFAEFKKLVGDAQAHYNVARMLHHVQQDEQCREHLAQALQANPDLAPARQLLAQLNGKAPAAGGKPQVGVDFEGLEDEGAPGQASSSVMLVTPSLPTRR